jgi:DNA-binding NarL/FixJ family response regulator
MQKISATRKSSAPGPLARRRILIVDDHPLMRRGLTALIDSEPDLIVCAEAATPRTGFEAVASSRPDLVITDLSMGDGDGEGLALVKDIRSGYEALPVLVLTTHDAPHYARRAFRAGANGYASKQELGETLLVAIRCVLNGEKYLSPKMSAGLDGK